MYFLTSTSRLNEQVVDKIVLQLNRVYPQILTNEEAEKFRNPKASLHTRLSDLLKHLQKKGDRHCQEFYRALQINAEQLYNDLPSRKILKVICIYPAQTGGGPFSCLHGEATELPHIHTWTLLNWGSLGPSCLRISDEPQSQLTEPRSNLKAVLWSDVHLAEVVHFGEQALQSNCLGSIIFILVEVKKQVFLPGWVAVSRQPLWIKSSLRSLGVITKKKNFKTVLMFKC